jgi:hypothetical protein
MLDESLVFIHLLFYQLKDGSYSTLELITAGVYRAAVLVGWIVLVFREGTASEVAVGFIWIPHATDAIPTDLELFSPPIGITSVTEPMLDTHIYIACQRNK